MNGSDPVVSALRGEGAGPNDQLARLKAQFARRAETEGHLDVAYRHLDTPVGNLLLAATGSGLVRVAFGSESVDSVLTQLAERISPRVLHAPRRLDCAARQLEEYFAGRRQRFELELDLSLATGFRRHVLARLREVGYATTVSYAELAQASGRPRAARAVGSACATNPVPLVVPCHRVLRSDGSLGGYGGGLATKRLLLELEAGNLPSPRGRFPALGSGPPGGAR